MLKPLHLMLIIFGGLCFSFVRTSVFADEIYDRVSNAVYGEVVSISSSGVSFDVGCNGNIKKLDWDDDFEIRFSKSCGAYKGWTGGGDYCEEGTVKTRRYWQLAVEPQTPTNVHPQVFGFAKELIGLSGDNLHYIDYRTNKKKKISTRDLEVVLSYEICRSWLK